MLGLPPSARIYFATSLVDMRNGVDGLRTIIEQVLKRNPNDGHLFVFVGKRRDMLKILFWDKNGYVVYFLLGVHIGTSESEASWAELLAQLVARGLSGVRLIVRDEHAGLIAAARKILPEVRQHLMRNVFSHVPQRHQKRVARELVAVLHADSLDAAKRNLRTFRLRFAKQFPEAVACLERGFADATTYFAFPEEHWMRIRSTNGLERLHSEIKRRTRAIGAFPDRASALRLITAVALQTTAIWRDRSYLDMSLLDEHYAVAV
jgi:putative transposase